MDRDYLPNRATRTGTGWGGNFIVEKPGKRCLKPGDQQGTP
jgi:hypothetical protein